MSRLKELQKLGQSVWIDLIHRQLLRSGELARLVRDDGLRGVTSNPTIFEKAIAGSADYDADIALGARAGLSPTATYERLALADIRAAAAVLRPVHDATEGADGFACLEVSPFLAHDTSGTIDEAHRLWRALDRPDVMVKVPGTRAGLPAIERLISDGLNINVTLLFSREVYREVAERYFAGLEARAARGEDLRRVSSVASVFVSRIDAAVDAALGSRLQAARSDEERARLAGLVGKVAVASARLTYQLHKELHATPRWAALARRGARVQRLLWASTGTKDPRLPDTYYVESLIGPGTVDTMPGPTLDAFRDHGRVQPTLEEDLDGARQVLATLERCRVSLDAITARLVDEGVMKFADSFAALLAAIGRKVGRVVS